MCFIAIMNVIKNYYYKTYDIKKKNSIDNNFFKIFRVPLFEIIKIQSLNFIRTVLLLKASVSNHSTVKK